MNWVTSLFHIVSIIVTALRAVTRRSVSAELEIEIREKLDSEALAKVAKALAARRDQRERSGSPNQLRATDPFERH